MFSLSWWSLSRHILKSSYRKFRLYSFLRQCCKMILLSLQRAFLPPELVHQTSTQRVRRLLIILLFFIFIVFSFLTSCDFSVPSALAFLMEFGHRNAEVLFSVYSPSLYVRLPWSRTKTNLDILGFLLTAMICSFHFQIHIESPQVLPVPTYVWTWCLNRPWLF